MTDQHKDAREREALPYDDYIAGFEAGERSQLAQAIHRALTDADIDKIAETMPGGMDSFLKGWGWRQFARAVEDEIVSRAILARAAPSASPAALTACQGMNCGSTDGMSHSLECQAEHAAAIAGGSFVKGSQK
ncbi:hypothetical protein CNECB9_2370157 [Cupriavidus necator]|uniref:Uncharacterized protein n=1 Tax=Cupriavidus necator TaxID=106590 RepID=A0A1K0IRP7_CUPNE|nr:hypothetical protein CNECB9_2370157 [Cupriavidus necator]